MRPLLKALGLAEWGGDELAIALLSCGALALALSWLHPLVALAPLPILGIVVWFFRDPERIVNQTAGVLLAACDGTVADITEVDEPAFIRGRALRIGVFMSPFNVHVNRAPCAATVAWRKHNSGECLPAYNPAAPERNESLALGLIADDGVQLVVKQITGVLARRLICAVEPGTRLARGQRYGMIKFGSRTELYVPVEWCGGACVQVGEAVTGGVTPLCRIVTPDRTPDSMDAAEQVGGVAVAGTE